MPRSEIAPQAPLPALRFQRRLWAAERAAWWVQCGIVLAALVGLAGGGPLARASARRQGLAIEYERIARNERSGELDLTLLPELVRGGRVHLHVDRRWLSGVEIERIVPEPERGAAGDDAVGFTFEVPEGGAAHVRFLVHYQAAGWRSGRVRVEGGPEIVFSQWIFP